MEENGFIEPLHDDSSLEDEQVDFHVPGEVMSDYEPSLAESAFGSITSSIAGHVFEYGRRYHRFRSGQYPLPNDDEEHLREMLRHNMMKELLEGKLFFSPIPDTVQRIIDLGTGFGEWAIEVAELFPGAQVIGVDLSPVQPVWVPPNLEYRVDDVEDDWKQGDDFDFMFLRFTGIVIKDQDVFCARAFENLKPGGWIEVQDVYPRLGCDDNTMPPNYPVSHFYRLVSDVFARQSFHIFYMDSVQARLEAAGFVNVQRKVFNIPVGEWPRDRKLRTLGVYMRELVVGFMKAMAARPFAEAGFDAAEMEQLIVDGTAAMQDRRIHVYLPLYFVWAQKPLL